MKIMRRLIVLLACCVALPAFAGEIKTLDLPPAAGGNSNGQWDDRLPPRDAVAISDNGSMMMIDRGGAEATLYPSLSSATLDGAIPRRLGAEAMNVIFKRCASAGYFVVACNGDKTLYLLNDKTAAVVKTFAIAVDQLISVSAPRGEQVPYLYYTGERNSAGVVGRIDLRSMTDQGPIDMPQNSPLRIELSENGSFLYASRTYANDQECVCYRLTPGGPTGKPASAMQLFSTRGPRSAPRPDPFDQFVAADSEIYSPSMSNVLNTLAAPIVALSSIQPLLFTFDGSHITAFSTNTFKGFGNVDFAAPEAPDQPQMPPNMRRRRVRILEPLIFLCDDAHRTLVAVSRSSVAAIPFANFNISAEPALCADLQAEQSPTIGQSWTATLLLHDASAQVALDASAPAGLSLQGTTLRWTPTAAAAGTARIPLVLSDGALHRTQEITVEVTRPCIVLPFIPNGLAIAPDGKTAVAYSLQSMPRFANDPDSAPPRLALLDLRKLTILADRVMPEPFRIAAIDKYFVYVPLQNSDAFLALSPTDLSNVKRIFTQGSPWKFESVGSRLFMATTNGTLTNYSLPQLVAQGATIPGRYGAMNNPTPLPQRLRDGWFDHDIVYGDDFKQVRWIVQDQVFAPLTENRGPARMYGMGVPTVAPWDVRADPSGVMRLSGQTIARLTQDQSGVPPVVLDDVPAVAVITHPQPQNMGWQNPQQQRDHEQVDLIDLVNGNRLPPVVLSDEPVHPTSGRNTDTRTLTAAAGVIVAQIRDRVFVLHPTDFDIARLSTPLEVQPPPELLAIAGDRATTAKYHVTGGAAPLHFSLGAETAGVQLDADTGAITIDPQPLLQDAAKQVLDFIMQRFPQPNDSGSQGPQRAVDDYRRAATEHFRSLLGKGPKGVVVALPLSLTVQDNQGQTTNLSHVVLVDAPASFMNDAIAAEKKEIAQQRLMNQQQFGQMRGYGAPPPADSDDVARLRQEVTDLQAENARLRAKVDALTDVLARQQISTTRP